MVSWGRPSHLLHLLIDSLLLPLFTANVHWKDWMLKLKLQYLGHLMWRANSLEKTLMLGKIESRRRRGWHRMRWLDDVTDSMDMSLSKLQEMGKDREDWCAAVYEVAKSWTWLEWLNNNNLQPNHEKVLFVLKPWLIVISLSLLFLIWVSGPPFRMQKLF